MTKETVDLTPLVSVIIPAYNRETMIERAVDSALAQTYQNIEVIVIDDASIDSTVEKVEAYDHKKLSLIKLSKNVGQCKARNEGIKVAKGVYIAFLDSDDTWNEKKIEKQVEHFQKSTIDNLGAVFCYCYTVNESNNTTTKTDRGYLRGDLHNEILGGYCPPSPTLFLVKKDALIDAGMFDEGLPTFVDIDLWIRVSEKSSFDYVEDYLATKYEHEGEQIAKNIDKRLLGLKIFMSKWKDKIIESNGIEAYKKIRNGRLRSLVNANLNSVHKHPRVIAVKCIKVLLMIPEKKPNLYVKALLTLIFGTIFLKKMITSVKSVARN